MNAVSKVNCQFKTKYMIMLFTIGLGLILPLPLIFVEAAPKELGFERGQGCSTKRDKNDKIVSITCCWREAVPGQFLGKTYCQTCDINDKCDDKSAQSYSSKIPDAVIQPDNEIVKEIPLTQQPPIESDKDSLIEDKITKEPLQSSNSEDENNNNVELTESGNSDDLSDIQGNGNLDGPQDFSDSNGSRNT